RGADENHGTRDMGLDQHEPFLRPPTERALGEIAVALAAPAIVEHKALASVGFGPCEQRSRLRARHVGHVARKENERRPGAAHMAEGHTSPVGKWVEA